MTALAALFLPTGSLLSPFAPELWIIATIVAVLLVPFFAPKSNAACGFVALAGLCAALIGVLVNAAGHAPAHECFAGTLIDDPFALVWKGLLLTFVIGIVLLWFATTRAAMHAGDAPEFFTLLLGATLGMSLMGATANLLMVFLTIELASLPSYVLAGFRKTDRVGAEASLKYVLFGAAATSIMAYGLSLLYALYGTLNMAELALRVHPGAPGASALLVVALLAILVGVGFKIAAVPFHFWCPDVFEGAGIDVAAFLSVASKGAALVLLIRLLVTFAHGAASPFAAPLPAIATTMAVLGALTATVGNAAALKQENIKRLLAYSSIAHAGYMLCAAALFNQAGAAGEVGQTASGAMMAYLAVYLFMNLGAFTVAGLVGRHHGGHRDGEQLRAYAGLGTRAPLLAVCMTAFLFSLIGLPPLAGFAIKLNLLYVLAARGSWFWWLVAIIAANTIVSVYYYARVIKTMYLDPAPAAAPPFRASLLGSTLAAVCAAMLVLLLIGFDPLRRLTGDQSPLYLREKSAPTATAHASPDRIQAGGTNKTIAAQ